MMRNSSRKKRISSKDYVAILWGLEWSAGINPMKASKFTGILSFHCLRDLLKVS